MFRKALKSNTSAHQTSFSIGRWITPILNLLCVALIIEIKLHGIIFWPIESLLFLGNTLNVINVIFFLRFPEKDPERGKAVAIFVCTIFYSVAIMGVIVYVFV